jgi:hypothetical protein
MRHALSVMGLLLAVGTAGCLSEAPEGLAAAEPAQTTVLMDFEHRPLPLIPLPFDVATRYDATSVTGRRINASMIAPTGLERRVRALIDDLDGWGLVQPMSIPFTGALDVQSILDGHRDADYDFSNDVIYLIDVTRSSPDFGKLQALDLGMGNYPVGTEDRDEYWANDTRADTLSIVFEEADEDLNRNGVLDPGEDTDGDGVLDAPNYLPGMRPAKDDLAGRMDALMSFYEAETHTVLTQPVVPLRPQTTYAMVITKRLKDAAGNAVGSPFAFINHAAQSKALEPLAEVLPAGLAMGDVAFAYTFTTQSTITDWVAVRDGLYGHGVQAAIGEAFPAHLDTIELAKDAARFPDSKNLYVVHGEEFASALELINTAFSGSDADSVNIQQLLEANKYVDYYVIGSYMAPQLYDRVDAAGNPLPKNDQSWPADLHRVPAKARAERVYFTLVMPRREVSVRGEGKPAPVAILGHGHGGSRFDAVGIGPYFARHGVATIAIDNPGHGLGIDPDDKAQATRLLNAFGLGPLGEATFKDRAFDQNFDGVSDSGADYWDFYLFHTRDNVRQTALDYMQLVRIIRSFDGTRRSTFDLNGDGTPDLAGDFDGDGEIDLGLGSEISMSGGSLGGIMAMLMGSIEPEISAVASLVGGGGLGTVARRSINRSVRRAILLRTFGPVFVGTSDGAGATRVETIIPDINESPSTLHLNTVEGVEPGDTMVVANLATGEFGCGHVNAAGQVRAPVASDLNDPIEIRFYRGDVQTDTHCEIDPAHTPYAVVDTFEEQVLFHQQVREAGDPLEAMAEGLGHSRATPDFRRFVGLGQLVMSRADPANYARHMMAEPFTYPGTGQTTGAHILMTTAIGDLNVPVDAGMLFARAVGVLEWREPNPAYGVPDSQVLIDNYVLEGMDELMRFTGPDGRGVLMDPDNFSGDNDLWPGIPRLDPPIRSGFDRTDPLGGKSGSIFGYGNPQGQHGFAFPGVSIDEARERCADQCAGEACEACATLEIFDVGNFHFNLMGAYMRSAGTELEAKACHATWDCPEIAPIPADREGL